MLVRRIKPAICTSVILFLPLTGCGKKKSDPAPEDQKTSDWDGLSDQNTSDLSIEEVEP